MALHDDLKSVTGTFDRKCILNVSTCSYMCMFNVYPYEQKLLLGLQIYYSYSLHMKDSVQ